MSSNPSPEAVAGRVARGLQPEPWTGTFTHREHGELTFRAKVPVAKQLAKHSVLMDNELVDAEGDPSVATYILVAALAGLRQTPEQASRSVLVDLPVIAEHRDEDPETGGVTITSVFYDAEQETDTTFLVEVWTAYSVWRNALFNKEVVEAVKGPSGATTSSSSESSTSFVAPTDSPSTTDA